MSASARTETVTFESPETDGAAIRGTLACCGDSPAPALILIPDVHGVSPLYLSMGERLAAEGFHTLVLDMYSREGAPRLADMTAVNDWIAALPDRRVLGDIGAARTHLSRRNDVRADAIGILGFCLGGQYALMAACTDPHLSACASFYGMLRYAVRNETKPHSALDLAPRLSCPLLGLYGADDPLIPPEDVAELREILSSAGKDFDLVTYAGAGHAFLNEARPEAYRPDAARDAWAKAVSFFQTHLS